LCQNGASLSEKRPEPYNDSFLSDSVRTDFLRADIGTTTAEYRHVQCWKVAARDDASAMSLRCVVGSGANFFMEGGSDACLLCQSITDMS